MRLRLTKAVTLTLFVALLPAAAGSACSGTNPSPEVVETLEALPAALDAAEEALGAVRPILLDEDLEIEPKEREIIDRALTAMEGVLELGRALIRDISRATQSGGWAWADLVVGALTGIVDILKLCGVDVPQAVNLAAGAAQVLLPVIERAAEG